MKMAVFASGGGSNFEAICRASEDSPASPLPVLCITDRPDAGVLGRAAARNVPSAILKPSSFPTTEVFAEALLETLRERNVDFIVLAGYLKKIPESVVSAFEGRMINIHPSLLPAFGGKGMYGDRVHRAVIDYGARFSGATVHLVDNSYDTGPVVLQATVPVHESDSPGDLAARVLLAEHQLLPEAVRLFATNRIRIDGRRVSILPHQTPNHNKQ